MKKTLTYESAYSELAAIAQEMESESVSIDLLSEKVKRAAELVIFCQNKLRSTESEVNKIISKMEEHDEE